MTIQSDGTNPRLAPLEPADRRGLILRSAADSFATYGYQGTSLNDICSGAGIAKPTLYHHFSSKAAILYEVLEDLIETQIAVAEAPERQRLSAPDRLLEFMKDMVVSLEARPGQVRCFYESAFRFLPPELRDQLEERREYYRRQLGEILLDGRRSGVFSFEEENITALSIFGMCGWAYNWYRPDGPLTSDEIATRMWRLVMAGIGGEQR